MKAALYARVSSETQERQETIASQVQQLREHAKISGLIVTGEYLDDGYSGDLLARPALDRLRDDAAARKFDAVLILSPDRLARKWVYGEVICDELRRQGLEVRFLNQKDDGTAESKLLLGMTGLFGQYEKAKFLERVRRGKIYKVKAGAILSARPPFGYRYIHKTATTPGRLEIDEATAPIVRLIFSLCADEGMSIAGVVRELARRGIPPAGRWGARPYWALSSVGKILRSETYAGLWHFNKHSAEEPLRPSRRWAAQPKRQLRTSRRLRPRDQWIAAIVPAIVTRDLYERARAQLQVNRALAKRRMKLHYLLRGLCVCGECGLRWTGNPVHGVAYYRCQGRRGIMRLTGRLCGQGMVQAARLERAVWTAVRAALVDPRLILQQLPQIERAAARGEDAAQRERAELLRQREQGKAAEERLLDAFTAGMITGEQLASQMDKLRARMAALAERQARLDTTVQAPPPAADAVASVCRKIAQGLEVADRDAEVRERLLRMLVDEIVLSKGAALVRGAIPAPPADASFDGCFATTPSTRWGRIPTPLWRFELALTI